MDQWGIFPRTFPQVVVFAGSFYPCRAHHQFNSLDTWRRRLPNLGKQGVSNRTSFEPLVLGHKVAHPPPARRPNPPRTPNAALNALQTKSPHYQIVPTFLPRAQLVRHTLSRKQMRRMASSSRSFVCYCGWAAFGPSDYQKSWLRSFTDSASTLIDIGLLVVWCENPYFSGIRLAAVPF